MPQGARVLEYQRISLWRRPQALQVVVGQKGHGKNWSQVSVEKAAENVCRSSKKQQWRKETWWWNAAVDSAVKEMQRCWKTWKKGGSKEEYQNDKRLTKYAVYLANSQAKQEVLNSHSSCVERTLWAPLECRVRLGLGLPLLSLSRGRPGPPHPTWAGDQGHEADEMLQGCWCIHDRSWNAKSLWSWRGSADSWSNRGYHPFWEDPCWMGGEYHRLLLQGQERHPWARKLSRPQIARPGHEGSREGGREPSMATRAHVVWHAVWVHAWTKHHRRQIHCMPVRRKVLCHQLDTVLGLCWSRKGIRSCTQTCHLVGSSQVRRWWVAGAAHTEHVWKNRSRVCAGCNLSEEFRVKKGVHQGSCLSPLLLITILEALSHRMSLGKPVCRWPGHHHWIAEGITTEADPLENQHGRKMTSGQHGQNQGPDIWARARHASEVWQRPLRRVSQGRMQKIHFFVVVVPDGSIRNAVASLAIWSLLPASSVNGALDRPGQKMAD